jgi:RNA polymerase sigma-B factor
VTIIDESTHVQRPDPAPQWSDDRENRADRTRSIVAQLAASSTSSAQRTRLRNELAAVNLPVATAVAARFRGRGIEEEDLQQVAALALVRAATRYDPATGPFLSYAVPTMTGEVRRHFRDHGWMVRPPRRIQELQARVNRASAQLNATLGRAPRPSELAQHLDAALDDVVEALGCHGCFNPASLDAPVGTGDTSDAGSLGDLLGDHDTSGIDAAEARTMLAPLVRALPERDRLILQRRFFDGLTQREIGEELGVTQMQVSRLLNRILTQIRHGLEQTGARPPSVPRSA